MLAYVEFDSGDTALYEGLWKGPGPVGGQRQHAGQALDHAAAGAGDLSERRRAHAPHHRSQSEDDRQFKAGFLLQARAAVAAVRGEASSIPSIDDSLQTMRLINRMFGV